jgi:phenylpyruvate tautomerase PptA (4-oxalocrotonate tautomerase family)
MPLVRIDLRTGTSPSFREKLGDLVFRALHETAKVPAGDHFQVITEHDPAGLRYDPAYLGVARTDAVVFIQITLNAGRTLEVKKVLYHRIAELLHTDLGIRKEDVLISLVEVAKENWSFGNGVAPYAE